jgi:hypothetical protein
VEAVDLDKGLYLVGEKEEPFAFLSSVVDVVDDSDQNAVEEEDCD